MAIDAAEWVRAHRALDGGGFSHSESGKGGPYLWDSLAMGRAFIDLYAATGGRDWLRDADAAGDFIATHFKDASGGFDPSPGDPSLRGVFAKPARQFDDQIATARFMNLLHRYTGKARYGEMAEHAMRYALAMARDFKARGLERPLPGLLLAERELSHAPTHITIVGARDDAEAMRLAAAARALPASYKRLDWWDRREGPLDNPDIGYPEMDQSAAFACGDRICSLPAFTAQELNKAVARMALLAQEKPAPAKQ